MNRRRFLYLGLAGLLLPPRSAQAGLPVLTRPIALGSLQDGRLFILEGKGRLLLLEAANPQHFGELRVLAEPRFDNGVDLTVGRWHDRRVVAVSYRRQIQTPITFWGRIAVFDAESGRQESFELPPSNSPDPSGAQAPDFRTGINLPYVKTTYFSGLAFDPAGTRLYTSGVTDATIYFAELRGEGKTDLKTLTSLRGVSRLGALIHDPLGPRLYVSDPREGIVYRIDTGTGRYEAIASKLGTPTALMLLPDREELLISDGLNGHIWKLRLWDKSEPVDLAPKLKLREPSGLALLPSGILCVAEAWNNRLRFLELGGKEIGRYPANS